MAANPVTVPCPQGAWTKVATNVVTGVLHMLTSDPQYIQTYRVTGDPAPSVGDKDTEGIGIFINGSVSEPISASAAVDVYIFCELAAGEVRADL